MNIDEAKLGVGEIGNWASDDESAHILEDKLRGDFIRYVATDGPEWLKEIAVEILRTEDIEFARWYA